MFQINPVTPIARKVVKRTLQKSEKIYFLNIFSQTNNIDEFLV